MCLWGRGCVCVRLLRFCWLFHFIILYLGVAIGDKTAASPTVPKDMQVENASGLAARRTILMETHKQPVGRLKGKGNIPHSFPRANSEFSHPTADRLKTKKKTQKTKTTEKINKFHWAIRCMFFKLFSRLCFEQAAATVNEAAKRAKKLKTFFLLTVEISGQAVRSSTNRCSRMSRMYISLFISHVNMTSAQHHRDDDNNKKKEWMKNKMKLLFITQDLATRSTGSNKIKMRYYACCSFFRCAFFISFLCEFLKTFHLGIELARFNKYVIFVFLASK